LLGRDGTESLALTEKAALVNEADNPHLALMHFIHETERIYKKFAKHRITDLRNDATTLAKRRQAVGPFYRSLRQAPRILRRMLRNVGEGVLKRSASTLGPDYLAAPSSHLRRSSSATWA